MLSFSTMEDRTLGRSVVDLEGVLFPIVEYSVVQTSLLVQKSLLWLLLIGLLPSFIYTNMDLIEKDQKFPVAELSRVKEPVAENMDASETEDNGHNTSNDEDGDEDDDEDDESEEDSDDYDDSDDDDTGIIGRSDSDDDDSDSNSDDSDSNSDNSDSNSDDDDGDEEEDEDEDEQPQPPFKRKK